jgi:hypothetical protein
MRRAILFALFPAAIFAQQASFEGIVVDKLSHEPLSGVHVMLITGVMGGVTGSYGALSDREGHFSFGSLRPGTYLMLCERSGYLHTQPKDAGIPNISLKPGQQLKDFKLEMIPRAIVSGRVVDENGDPVQGVNVEPVAVPPESMSLSMMLGADRERATDDRGEFRLTVVPGKYYVKATDRGNLGNQFGTSPERRNDGSVAPPYSPTFYPSTAVMGRATQVEAIGGKDSAGLEIRLTRQQGLSITGIVTGIPEGGGRVNVQVRQLRDRHNRGNNRGNNTGPDGKFSFTSLEPATYRVWATFRNGKSAMFSRTVEVQLDAGDPPPLTLLLEAGADVTGTLVVEGDPPGAAAEKRTIRLNAADNMSNGGGSGDTDRENGFQVSGVGSGKYRVHVDPLPENAYVKSVDLDGVPGTANLFEIASGSRGARIKVTVSRGGAQVSGRVLDSEGNRLLTPLAMVGLMEGPDEDNITNTEVTPDGRYSFKSVRPGKYRLIGLNPFDMNIDNEHSWFKTLFDRGEEIELKENDRITKDVKLLPKEDANAKK